MAWSSLLHRLFQSNGAGDTLRSEVIPRVIPAGTVATFAGKNAPDGWLIADGRAVSRSQYSDLYNAIGTLYGNGDGSSTFNLPNLTHNYVRPTATPSEVGITLAPGLPNITAGLAAKGAIAWQGDVGAFILAGIPLIRLTGPPIPLTDTRRRHSPSTHHVLTQSTVAIKTNKSSLNRFTCSE